MPYFSHSMARCIKQSSQSTNQGATAPTRQIRSMPGGNTEVFRYADPSLVNQYRLKMTQRKMLFMQSLLRAQINQMMNCTTAFPIDASRQMFRSFKIDQNTVRHTCANVKIYSAKSAAMPDMSMSVRVYPRANQNPNTSLYLKILRHLARKHPYIIHTWEMFYDNEKVYIFQEWALSGNLVEFLDHNDVNENKAAIWAKQIYRALDFLGDLAIAHRDLAPIHLVVQPQSLTEIWLKLTGFKKAIIYWDTNNNDVVFCTCRPLEKQLEDGPNFQPPEVYGNAATEQYDPIAADIWSFGCNVYYMLSKQYPFNVVDQSNNIDEEIKHNVAKLTTVTQECRNFLFALMRGNANDRMPFDFIETHPWFKAHSISANKKATVQITTKKNMNKQKSMPGKKSKQLTKEGRSTSKAKSATPKNEQMVKAQTELNQLVRDINASVSCLSIRSASYIGSNTALSKNDAKEMAAVIEALRKKVVYLINSLKTLLPNLPNAKRDELMEDVSLLEVCSDAITAEQFEKYSSMMLQIMAKIDKLLDQIKPSWA